MKDTRAPVTVERLSKDVRCAACGSHHSNAVRCEDAARANRSETAADVPMTANEPMSPSFAVFNSHVNNAYAKASVEFVRMFGQKRFDRHIGRYGDGIMSIFDTAPNLYRAAWVAMVTVLVNERYAPASFSAAIKAYQKKIGALGKE